MVVAQSRSGQVLLRLLQEFDDIVVGFTLNDKPGTKPPPASSSSSGRPAADDAEDELVMQISEDDMLEIQRVSDVINQWSVTASLIGGDQGSNECGLLSFSVTLLC